MINRFSKGIAKLKTNTLFKNSSWGVIAHVSQSVLLSLFFVIIARKYSTELFAKYIIANVLYQLIAAFSTLGLSQWFIREVANNGDKKELVTRFLKMQSIFGVVFYFLNIALVFLLYEDQFIRLLTILFGVNIVFDNIINALKCYNIAIFEQKKTLVLLTVEALLKFIAGCLVYVFPVSILTLSIVLIVIRFITLNLFISYGSSASVNLKTLWKYKIPAADIKRLLVMNWPFLVLGSVSMINWRIANVIISKFLSLTDIANYEISYKVFSIAQILPVVVSSTVFPLLIKLYQGGDQQKFSSFYRKIHSYYMLFGLLSFTFIYSFADFLIPLGFGSNYAGTAVFTKQMFLTILIFPTAFLQANMLISMKLEKIDMLLNVLMLFTNLCICLVGLYYVKSLSVVNTAIFVSFLLFHVLQDLLLVKKKISSVKDVYSFYVISLVCVSSYVLLSKSVHPMLLFVSFWVIISIALLTVYSKYNIGKYFAFKPRQL